MQDVPCPCSGPGTSDLGTSHSKHGAESQDERPSQGEGLYLQEDSVNEDSLEPISIMREETLSYLLKSKIHKYI